MSKAQKLYWDTCAWLGFINGEQDKARELRIVYGHAQKGHYVLWTSALSVIEARRLKVEQHAQKPLTEENEKTLKELFEQPFVKPISMDFNIAASARRIWRATPELGKFQDAIHLASALWWNLPVMHTYDNEDLLHLSGKFTCRNGTPLTICYPDETTDGPLFAQKKSAGDAG